MTTVAILRSPSGLRSKRLLNRNTVKSQIVSEKNDEKGFDRDIWRLTDALIRVIDGDALEDIAPVGPGEVRLDARPGDDVDPVLGVVEGLEHDDEGGAGVAFLVHAGAVVVQLDHAVLVLLGHLVHYAPEPLERALLPSHPVEVRALRHEGLLLCLGRALHVRRRRRLLLLDVVEHVLDDADQRSGSDAESDEQ